MKVFKRAVFVRRLQALIPIVFLSALALYAFWPWLLLPARAAQPRTIILYGFSILGDVMNDAIFPAFQAEWQAKTGERVEFISSFAGSGTLTNQLIMGVPAELALLSLERAPGLPIAWIFNVWGSVDLVNAFYQANATGLSPGQLGAAYFIPTLIVPLLLITHGLAFRVLLQHQQEPVMGQSRRPALGYRQ